MNAPIVRLFVLVLVLFAVLVGFTSYWAVFDAEALKEKPENRRPLLEPQQIKRGTILAADGTVIAESIPKGQGQERLYVRRYPQGALFGHPIGYASSSSATRSSSVPERRPGRRVERVRDLLDELRGTDQEGNDIVTDIDAEAQRVAQDALRTRSASPASARRGRDRAGHRRGPGDGQHPRLSTRTPCPSSSRS